MSVISWLDASADEQRRVNEIVRLFSQRETQDTMGGRRIVVAISDALFPGTSVLHTRARYLLFVPWLCQRAVRSQNPVQRLDRLERELIERFKQDTDVPADDRDRGLIGRVAGAQVKQLPSIAYWTALTEWKILEWPGSIAATLDRMGSLPSARRREGADELVDREQRVWHPGVLERRPEKFPTDGIDGGFALKHHEAQWLAERWAATAPGSMLVHVLAAGEPPTGDQLWDHAPCWSSTPDNTALVEHAKWFSLAIAGAQALYAFLVAQRYVAAGFNSVEVDLDEYRGAIEDWEQRISDETAAIGPWDPHAFWALLASRHTAIDQWTRTFFDVWFDVLRRGGTSVADDPALADVVTNRETRLKSPAQSRLTNDALLANWGGGIASGPDYRWSTVRGLIDDVLDGLGRPDART